MLCDLGVLGVEIRLCDLLLYRRAPRQERTQRRISKAELAEVAESLPGKMLCDLGVLGVEIGLCDLLLRRRAPRQETTQRRVSPPSSPRVFLENSLGPPHARRFASSLAPSAG
jgi:hypothetical protein